MPRRLRVTSSASLLIPLVLSAPAVTSAQDPRETVVRHVDRFTAEDGLAENHVRTVLQDRTGFIWVVTRGGVLQRYDGHAFVEYRALSPDAPIELSRGVRLLILDAEGALWAATSSALFRVDQSRWTKIPVALDSGVTSWTKDDKGRLWFLDGGSLKWIDTERTPPVVVAVGDRNQWSNAVLGAGRGGAVWIAKTSGNTAVVTRFDPVTGTTRSFASDVGALLGVTEDSAGRVWLSGVGGLSVLEPAGGAFHPVDAIRGRTTPIAPDENGGFLAATNDWMARIDTSGRVTERLTSPEVFGRNAIPNALLTDREGGVWLATTTAGLFRLHTTRSAFDNYSSRSTPAVPLGNDFVMALHERSDGTLWLGTLGGDAYRITPDWRQAQRFRGERSTNGVWDFEEDADGNLWMGTSLDLCRLQSESFRCHDVPGSVIDIERDAAGWFWLAKGRQGLISFDPRRRVLGERVPQVSELSAGQDVMTLFADRDSNYLWIGAGSAILRARADGGRIVSAIQRLQAPLGAQDLIYDFHRDRRGNFFVATGAGLLQWKEDSSAFVPIELRELRESTIFSISDDSSGRLWLGSSHGLVQYSPASGHARRYGRRDNFLSGELNRRAALRRRSGEMLFGGIEGVTQFDPDVVSGSHGNAPVVLTRWTTMTANGPVETPITAAERVRLEPGDRAFTVEFAELSFAPNPGRRYRYRLEGLTENWIEATDRVANYAAPPPGEYVFRVQAAAGGDGEWSGGASIILDVIPPFWKTAWFQAALVLAAGLLMWLAHQSRLRQAVVAERLRLRISRDLHDEIGAGLSSIALLSDAGARGNGGLELKRIGESARNMVADLREIVWAIDPEADRTADVVSRMRDVAASLLHDVKVTFDVQAVDASGRITMEVRRDLLLLYKEILHNIAKHAEATEVHITLQVHRGSLELTIADNGVGFSPNGSRTGTGLKSLSERAGRLGGELQLDSEPGRGTTVRFRLQRT